MTGFFGVLGENGVFCNRGAWACPIGYWAPEQSFLCDDQSCKASASSTYEGLAANVIDGNYQSKWMGSLSITGATITIDFQGTVYVKKIIDIASSGEYQTVTPFEYHVSDTTMISTNSRCVSKTNNDLLGTIEREYNCQKEGRYLTFKSLATRDPRNNIYEIMPFGHTAPCFTCFEGKYLVEITRSRYTYQNSEYQYYLHSECQDCVPGKYKSIPGSSSCVSCELGKYSPTSGATANSNCSFCEEGKYSDTVDASVCKVCPLRKISPAGSDNVIDCLCDTGYTASDGGPCTACAVSTYKEAMGSAACTACPENSVGPVGSNLSTSCKCKGGYNGSDSGHRSSPPAAACASAPLPRARCGQPQGQSIPDWLLPARRSAPCACAAAVSWPE